MAKIESSDRLIILAMAKFEFSDRSIILAIIIFKISKILGLNL